MNKNSRLMYFSEHIRFITRGIKIINQISPKTMTIRYVGAFVQAVTPFVPIYMTSIILNELSNCKNVKKLITYVLLTVSLTFVFSITSNYLSRKENVYYSKLRTGLDIFVSEKSQKMDFELVEGAELSKLREKITEVSDFGGGLYRIPIDIKNLISSILSIIIAIITIINMFTTQTHVHSESKIFNFVNSQESALILIVLLALLSSDVVFYKKNYMDKFFEKLDDESQIKAQTNFYRKQYFEDNKAAKDIRIFNERELIIKEIEENSTKKLWKNLNISFSPLYKSKKVQLLVTAISGSFIYAYVGIKAMSGAIKIGSIAKYYGSIAKLISSVGDLCFAWQYIENNNKYLSYLFDFIDAKSCLDSGGLSLKKVGSQLEIEFHNVSYKYKEGDVEALNNFSFKFNSGEHIAIVGKNGSGKTTLIKLMCRLYDPDSGYITLNGIDIKKYNYEEYLNLFSVVFQDFKLLASPVGQNIAASYEYNCERVWDCLALSGMGDRVRKFEKKLDQSIYRQFEEDGIDLSKGEEQKIAIARAVYKDAPIVILDEPTAALDPIAEFDIYAKFDKISKNKTTVYISHRLSSCRFCNHIIVLDNGKLVQHGSHNELVTSAGIYRSLWNAQAQYYNNEI